MERCHCHSACECATPEECDCCPQCGQDADNCTCCSQCRQDMDNCTCCSQCGERSRDCTCCEECGEAFGYCTCDEEDPCYEGDETEETDSYCCDACRAAAEWTPETDEVDA